MALALRARLKRRMAAWVLKRQGRDELPVELRARRLYILPTRAGVGFALLLLCMLIAGLNYGNSLALFLTFWLVGLALVAMYRCHRNLLHVVTAEALTTACFAGERGRITLTLRNDSALARQRIELDLTEDAAENASVDLPVLSTRALSISVSAPVRGILRIGRLRLSTSYPFGLFRAWTWLHLPLELIVYPRPRGNLPPPQHAGTKPGQAARGAGDEDEWLGLRVFRAGDSPRQVAWKAYARGAPLLVKEYASAGSDLRVLDYADLRSLGPEARLEQLARWIVDAEARDEHYALMLPGTQLDPDRGPEHRHRCLKALALYGLTRGVA
ncbi:MAG TPA: DUF58 domain-containing protein [Steroidobacteraceae bacterium]|nr:DUF58 domain-containing protein [Steroidobacteraceae bacterium]